MPGRRRRGHGEGSVFAYKGGFAAILDLGWIDGRRTRKWVYSKTERETLAKLNALRRRQEQGENLAAAPRAMGEWLTEWLSTKEREGTRPSTLRGYRWLIETHVRPALGKVALEKVTPTMIRRLLAAKQDAGLSSATVRHIHGMIRNVLGDAEREELVHRNAARAVRAPTVRQIERQVLSVEDARRLIESIRGDRLEALWLCALTVGLRRGELLGLRWTDIDFESQTLVVRQTVLRVGGKLDLL